MFARSDFASLLFAQSLHYNISSILIFINVERKRFGKKASGGFPLIAKIRATILLPALAACFCCLFCLLCLANVKIKTIVTAIIFALALHRSWRLWRLIGAHD